MSRNISAPRWGFSAVLAGAVALVLTVLLAIGLAPQANAAFSTGKCEGADITGRGASFARDAHKVFNFNFANVFCIGTGGFESINVTYEPQGSGAGITSVIDRGLPPRFGMSDDPPEPSQVAQMNAGHLEPESDENPNDDGQIHVIPAAVGAVAPLVNFPDDCDPDDLPDAARTDDPGDAEDDNLIRVRFTKQQFEKAWAKDPAGDEWDEVFPDLAGGECVDEPIIRVVRFDKSGTTFAFKDYLNTINGARNWLANFTADNREWPSAEFGTGGQCGGTAGPGKKPDNEDHLTSACASGNDDLTIKLVATDGSIGYSDISTARNNNPSLSIDAEDETAPFDNDVYWTQIQNGSIAVGSPAEQNGEGFTEPTASPEGFIEKATETYPNGGTKGSNCQAATFNNVPATTTQDWSDVSGVNAPSGYGICTMTYGLVFDDNADVWGNEPAEESKARTVKDYWENILSPGAQGQLFGNDYAPLPTQILNIAKAGIASVDWNKGEGGGGGEEGGNDNGKKAGGGGTVTPPLPGKPSNVFSLLRKSISSKNGGATLSVKLPGAGKLEVLGTARVKTGGPNRRKRRRAVKSIRVGKVTLNAGKAGTYNVPLKPSGAAKKELRKKGKLKVSLKFTFTPAGGDAKSTTSSIVLKMKRPKKRTKKK